MPPLPHRRERKIINSRCEPRCPRELDRHGNTLAEERRRERSYGPEDNGPAPRDQRRTREHEGRGKTSGATPGIPLALRPFSLLFLPPYFFLPPPPPPPPPLLLLLLLFSRIPSLLTRSRLSPLFQPRSRTDINQDPGPNLLSYYWTT